MSISVEMSKLLKKRVIDLFRSEDEAEWRQDRNVSFLQDVDYYALLRGLRDTAEPVYEYRTIDHCQRSHPYFGDKLFQSPAVLLYAAPEECACNIAVYSRNLELWVFPDDLTFAITSCYRVNIGGGAVVTEYRTYKGDDWADTDLHIDFVALGNTLTEISKQAAARIIPVYEWQN